MFEVGGYFLHILFRFVKKSVIIIIIIIIIIL